MLDGSFLSLGQFPALRWLPPWGWMSLFYLNRQEVWFQVLGPEVHPHGGSGEGPGSTWEQPGSSHQLFLSDLLLFPIVVVHSLCTPFSQRPCSTEKTPGEQTLGLLFLSCVNAYAPYFVAIDLKMGRNSVSLINRVRKSMQSMGRFKHVSTAPFVGPVN